MALEHGFHKNGRTKDGQVVDKLTQMRVEAHVVEGYLSTPSAKEAFNKISVMNPIWSAECNKGQYYICARIGIDMELRPRKNLPVSQKRYLENLGFNQSANPNFLMERKFEKLKMATADSGMTILVETAPRRSAAFHYDAEKDAFVPAPQPFRR